MTDDDEFDYLEEGEFHLHEEAIEHYRTNRPPDDVVEPIGLDKESILELNAAAAAGAPVRITEGGEPMTGPDGMPVGAEPIRVTEFPMPRPVISARSSRPPA